MDIVERFLKYVSFDTQSAEDAGKTPSTDKQLKLAEYLADELTRLTKETEKALGREHGTGMVSIDIDILQYDDIRLHLHDWEQDYIKQLYCQIKK